MITWLRRHGRCLRRGLSGLLRGRNFLRRPRNGLV